MTATEPEPAIMFSEEMTQRKGKKKVSAATGAPGSRETQSMSTTS